MPNFYTSTVHYINNLHFLVSTISHRMPIRHSKVEKIYHLPISRRGNDISAFASQLKRNSYAANRLSVKSYNIHSPLDNRCIISAMGALNTIDTVVGAEPTLTGRAKSNANLRPFVKGHAPLPGGGRPKKLTDAIDKELTEIRAHKVAKALITQAEKGNVRAIDTLADRVEGKVPQAFTGANGGPLQMAVAVAHVGIADITSLTEDDE